jgi:hypothetical protein
MSESTRRSDRWLRLAVGLGLGAFLLLLSDSKSCSIKMEADWELCPWDTLKLVQSLVALGIALVAATVLTARWLGDRQQRRSEDEARADRVAHWRAEHEPARQ